MSDDRPLDYYTHTIERLRARAQLYRQSAKDVGEEIVARVLDEVADAMEETISQPVEYDD